MMKRYKVGKKVVLRNKRDVFGSSNVVEIQRVDFIKDRYWSEQVVNGEFDNKDIDHEKTAELSSITFEEMASILSSKDGKVNSPSHYQNGARETIDKIKLLLTHEEYIGFIKGSYIKYEDRMDYKDGREVDLAKATYFADRLEKEILTDGETLFLLRDDEQF